MFFKTNANNIINVKYFTLYINYNNLYGVNFKIILKKKI